MRESSSANARLLRAQRMAERAGCDCLEQGYPLLPEARRPFAAGNCTLAYDAAVRAERLAERFVDADLRVFGSLANVLQR